MKEVPVSTDLLNAYGEMSVFLILWNALVWTAPTHYTICDLEKALFLALNSRYVVQHTEHMDVVACHTFL